MTPGPLRVRVPATSANLGCAFDCAALALSLYLDTEIIPRADDSIYVRYSGSTPERVAQNATNLIARVVCEQLAQQGKARGFELSIRNEIPIGVGLGSSAAAIIAGLVLAEKLLDTSPDQIRLIRQATEWEGHPDNVAAAWHGGFALALTHTNGIYAASVPVPKDLKLVLVVPDRALPTEETRRILPLNFSRDEAVHNLQRAAVLTAQFFSGTLQLERFQFDDRWHQPYRARMIPGLEEALALSHPALMGVCLSGAGSSVLAFVRTQPEEIGKRLATCFEKKGIKAETFILAADNRGAKGWLEKDKG